MTFKNALFTLLTAALIGRSYSEVLGCGGFVKLSQQYRNGLPAGAAMSSSPIDFTQISVRLLAKGTDEVKMSTECSPTGYFFVPSYDSGDYDLSVIDNANGDALTFAPARIPVTISSDNNAANLNKFEFEVTGATLTGTVSGVSPAAAAGVAITLISSATKAVVATAKPSEDAAYRFSNVLPGRYEVAAARPGWRFAQNYVTVDVTGSPVTSAPALAVTGFDVTGRVVLGAQGLAGAYLALYGESSSAAAVRGTGDLAAAPAVAQSFGGKPLVAVAASAAGTGAFAFEGVAAGEYAVVPVFAGASAGYQAAEASVAVSVGEAGAAVKEPIRVVSFAVSGRVVDGEGAGIEGASVRLGKLGAATTDAEGKYAISGLAATAAGSSAKLSVAKAHYTFEAERAVTVAHSLPETRAVKYDVCGRVVVVVPPAGSSARAYPRSVAVTPAAGGDRITVKTDGAGAFCVALPAGAYSVAVAAEAGLEMEPASAAVTVAAKPVVEGLEFRQKTLTVSGEIRALAAAAKAKAVTVALAGPVAKKAAVELAAGARSAAFAFEGLVAGTYTVSIEGAAADAEWCWAAEKQTITVDGAADKKQGPVVFAQKGYRMTVTASHAVTVAATLGAEKAVFAVSPAAPATLCLEEPGKYALEVRSEGYEFEAAQYAFDTAAPQPVAIRAARFRVSGTVVAATPEAARAITVGTAEGVPVAATVEGATVAYAAYVAAGASVRFIPTSAAEGTLFYPAERAAAVPAAAPAPAAVEPIAARPGLYLRGRVTPATEGVRVSVVVRGAPEGTPAVMTVLTDASGAYAAGPLRDDAEYRELFSHKGLVFNCTNCGDLGAEHVVLAMRLSSITVTVREGSAPVPGVLVSVSGGFGDSIYATNAATEADGSFTSGEIFPGSYFVRPMLKEYTFEPATRSVEVAEGDAPEVVFAAKRVAFSAYGRVLALDGTPRPGVLVVATPAEKTKATAEQATTDEDGRYRIRGLVPGVPYTVAAPSQAATPREHAVTVAAEDAKALDFIAYAAEESEEAAAAAAAATGRIEARIEAERSVLPTLEAVLKKAGSAATAAAVKRVKVGAIPMVEMGFVEPGKYELTLESSLAKKHYACKASPEVAEVEVKAGEAAELKIAMVCGEEKKAVEEAAAAPAAGAERKASVFSLIGLVAVMFASTKYNEIIEMVAGKKKVAKKITAADIVESTGVSANVAEKKAKYLNTMGGHDKSEFLPVNPNTYGRKKKSSK